MQMHGKKDNRRTRDSTNTVWRLPQNKERVEDEPVGKCNDMCDIGDGNHQGRKKKGGSIV